MIKSKMRSLLMGAGMLCISMSILATDVARLRNGTGEKIIVKIVAATPLTKYDHDYIMDVNELKEFTVPNGLCFSRITVAKGDVGIHEDPENGWAAGAKCGGVCGTIGKNLATGKYRMISREANAHLEFWGSSCKAWLPDNQAPAAQK